MGRDRKRQSAELRFGPALKALMICFFLGGAGVGYVYQKDQLNKLSHEYEQRERELRLLRIDNALKEERIEQLNSPRQLEERVKRMHPDMGLPSPGQVVVLREGEDAIEPGSDGRWYAGGLESQGGGR
jgi:hypothetical protein